MIQLTDEQIEKARQLIMNPPPNSKIAEAKEFGIDLTLTVENLRLSPQQRIEKAQMSASFFEEISNQVELPENKNFGTLLKLLAGLKADFIIVGETACFIYGWKHISPKLELLYSTENENLKKIISAIIPFNPRLRGFSDSFKFVFDEVALQNTTPLKFASEVGDIDLLTEIEKIGRFPEVEKMSVSRKIYGIEMKVLSIDGLIKAKRAAGRTKDLLVLPELEALQEVLAETEEN